MSDAVISALITVIPATILAAASLFVSIYTHILSSKESSEPNVNLEKITFDPNKMTVYTNISGSWNGSKAIDDPMLRWTKEHADHVFKDSIDGEDYLVINLCKRNETQWGDAVILAGVLDIDVKNHRDYIYEMQILRAYSKIAGTGDPLYESNYNVSLRPNHLQEIHFRIAYVFIDNGPTSINHRKIRDIYNAKTPETAPIILDVAGNKHMEEAGSIIAFTDSAYLIKCRGLRRDYFGTVRMQLVPNRDDTQMKVMNVTCVPDRNAKRSFRFFYKAACKAGRRTPLSTTPGRIHRSQ